MSHHTTDSDATVEDGAFVEIAYTARIDDGTVVDTTDPELLGEPGVVDVDADGPIVVVLGAGHVFVPVEDSLAEMTPGEERTVTVPPEAAFGEVDPTDRASIPVTAFAADSLAQNDRVTVDGRVGHVDSVTDGTATVDFNHPLAGSTLEYEVRARRRITDPDEQVAGLLGLYGLREDVSHSLADGRLVCTVEDASGVDAEWAQQKRAFVRAAGTHLDIDEIRFEERYQTA